MNIILWILQIILALAFLMSGIMKATQPIEKLSKSMDWVKHFPMPSVRLIGIVEILGALGLILPAATKIAPILTPIAALCLAITMIGAILTHLYLKEAKVVFAPAILCILTIVIAWGRFGPYHIG